MPPARMGGIFIFYNFFNYFVQIVFSNYKCKYIIEMCIATYNLNLFFIDSCYHLLFIFFLFCVCVL